MDELIPGLPEDMAIACLIRVDYRSHRQMRRVSVGWKSLIDSSDFHRLRKQLGHLRSCLCLVQQQVHKKSIQSRDFSQKNVYISPASSPRIVNWELMDFPEIFPEETVVSPTSPIREEDFQLGISLFDPVEQSWEWLPPVPGIFSNKNGGVPLFCQSVFVNRCLVLLGGWCPATYSSLKTVFIFSFASMEWRRAADMLTARSFFACAAVPHGNALIVAGGHDDCKNALSTAEIYDLDSDTWRPLPDMTQERDECRAVVIDGEFYAVSGYTTDMQGIFSSSADVYTAGGTWRRVENFWFERTCPVVTTDSGCVYGFQRHELMFHRGTDSNWVTVGSVPGNAKVCVCSAVGDNVYVATDDGSVYSIDTGKRSWNLLKSPSEFSGLVHASCTVKV